MSKVVSSSENHRHCKIPPCSDRELSLNAQQASLVTLCSMDAQRSAAPGRSLPGSAPGAAEASRTYFRAAACVPEKLKLQSLEEKRKEKKKGKGVGQNLK